CRRGLDHGVELPRTERLVAGKIDPAHRRLGALRDHIDEIGAVVAVVDDLRHHADLVASDMPVSLDDAVDVRLYDSAPQRAARLGFNGRCKIGVLDFLVAFESDALYPRR